MDKQTLLRWLEEARDAYHQLQMGRSVVSLSHNGKQVTYRRADPALLLAYIRRLEAEIAGRPARGGVGVFF